jgi:uncharacterized protein (TIGR02996 family)
MTTTEALLARLLEHPDDWDAFGVYADALEENGQGELAFAYRWMRKNRRRPCRRFRYVSREGWTPAWTPRSVPQAYRWGWWCQGQPAYVYRRELASDEALLPRAVWGCMKAATGHKFFPEFQEAVAGLAEALAIMRTTLEV